MHEEMGDGCGHQSSTTTPASPHYANNTETTMTSWSIAIKTVGSRAHTNTTTSRSKSDTTSSGSCGASPSSNNNNYTTTPSINSTSRTSSSISDTSEANFTIQVNPDDPLHSLHEKIEVVTGLTAEQQRLIYRGRIINSPTPVSRRQRQHTNYGDTASSSSSSSGGRRRRPPTEAEILLGETDNVASASFYNNTPQSPSSPPSSPSASSSTNLQNTNTPRVRDVNGLCDQQTIHLVPRLHHHHTAASSSSSNSRNIGNNNNNSNNGSGSPFGRGGGLNSLLGDLTSGPPSAVPTNNNNVTSLSGEAGMSLLAALLGAANGGGGTSMMGGSGNSTTAGGGIEATTTSGRSSSSGGGAILGSTEGLGGVIDRAVMMGVLDENNAFTSSGTTGGGAGSSTTTATATGGGEGLFSLLNSNGGGGNNNNNRPFTTTNTTRANSPTDPVFPRLSTPLTNTARRTMSRSQQQQQQRNRNSNSNNGNRNNSNASAAARARASAARLTESDIRVNDPGSVEPVRQGMMTLHTLLGNAHYLDYCADGDGDYGGGGANETNGTTEDGDDADGDDDDVGSDANDNVLGVDGTTVTSSFAAPSSSLQHQQQQPQQRQYQQLQQRQQRQQRQQLPPIRAPLDSHRQWYRGQWLDALDTVNQWLEATIVDIVLPEDVLPNYQLKQQQQQQQQQDGTTRAIPDVGWGRRNGRTLRRATPDAVVSANDLEGRRRLLLEPIPEDEIIGIEPPGISSSSNDNNDNTFTTPAGDNGMHYQSEEARRSILNARANEVINPSNNNNHNNNNNSPGEGERGAATTATSTNQTRPRPDNTNIQLLLIHYNGWPHRWDEWIRSDSERIRPFRTRTRHRTTSSLYSCPTPTAVFPAAPSTVMGSEEDDLVERSEMIVELGRVLGGVVRVLGGVIGARSGRSGSNVGGANSNTNVMGVGREEGGIHGVEGVQMSGGETSQLPWRQLPPPIRHENATGNLAPLLFSTSYDNEANSEDYDNSDAPNNATTILPDPRSYLDSARLRQLAPLIDRLGRTLTDAAPHIAALADALPTQPLLPSSPHPFGVESSAVTARTGDRASTREEDPIQSLAARASHLYFGIGNDDDDDDEEENDNSASASSSSALGTSVSPSAMTAISNNNGITEQILSTETTPIIDPDLTDYINGMVNTTRGVNGRDSGSGSGGAGGLLRNAGSGGDSLGTSLLANYLSSMGGGLSGGTNGGGNTGGDNTRVIRMGGGTTAIGGSTGPNGVGGGPGIDIHIHAIVTGPGMPGGTGGGIGGLGGIMDTGMDMNANNRNSGSPLFANATTFATATSSTPNNEEDNLFSELYSESPQPVNLHGEDDIRIEGIRTGDAGANDLNLLFAECRSIDEESTDDDEDLHPTEAEVALSMVDNISCIEADIIAASQLTHTINTDAIGASNTQSSGSSILALSEIESEESEATQPPPSQSSSSVSNHNDTSNAGAGAGALNSSPQGSATRSPSFGNRLFRRTFGRMSSRRGGNGRSA